ncbi:M20 family metallo-hydrolase [Paenibacillus radicis (ex Gao et al. 2016)]|uniref:Zn-dependent hydrolase n=1 Tax=Paenibacillus radicis (ex Gao et al. 2016) TaxID=1737354 RepID=A0A917H4H5_9BACL|nr:M20 family metallo-hydrolase [Paenibacillus radicis (ex Gao et al. 2016)]GGG67119.1 Zn-dependent hydrolase [Paenibacillus radicis (ex Gao et al. 2016)]
MGDKLIPDVARLQASIEQLSTFRDAAKPGWTRRPFTEYYDSGREWLAEQMQEAGLSTSIDAASNLIGSLPGSEPALPPILIGSHTDTVTGGGRFDGIIGVLAGIEIARRLQETGIRLRHPLQIVDFTAEEPSEFGLSTIGSRGMVGNLTAEMLELRDHAGLKLADAINGQGGDVAKLAEQARKPGDVALYLELHIEQGPVLEQTGHRLGAVQGIVGIQRCRVTLEGAPNHAGTTPMNMRNDALAGFCEIGLAFERHCLSHAKDAVGTIGKIANEPNASNVVPGLIRFELEIRSLERSIVEAVYDAFAADAAVIAEKRSLKLSIEILSRSDAVQVEAAVLEQVMKACAAVAPSISLPSGAGHDANQLARIAPIGMIFVPSKDGRSHCPEEWTDYADVAAGTEALGSALLVFDAHGERVAE